MIGKNLLELTAVYKLGQTKIRAKLAVTRRNIVRVETVPEETDEYTDGLNCRLFLSDGSVVGIADKYEDVIMLWNETLDSL